LIDGVINAMKGRPKGRPFRAFLEYFQRDSLALQHCNCPKRPWPFRSASSARGKRQDLPTECKYSSNFESAPLEQSGHETGGDHGIDRAIPAKAAHFTDGPSCPSPPEQDSKANCGTIPWRGGTAILVA